MNTFCETAPTDSGNLESSSTPWVAHFRGNVYRDWSIPWKTSVPLPAQVKAKIAASIAEFQRGESSEALHYLARSEKFAERIGDPDFHAASILFIREENGHAALLLRFMRLVDLKPRQRVFSDGVFRWLRAFSDLGWSSRVLIVAELIAQEYYPALRVATDHPVLRRICDKIVEDEEAHIRFQVARIAQLELELPEWKIMLRDVSQRILMAGAAVVVYWGHGRVLKMRSGPCGFLQSVLRRNRAALRGILATRGAWKGGGQKTKHRMQAQR